jgi:hypothetical protein
MPNPTHTVLESKWATRGWKLQEAVLSPKRLFITDSQVYFECDGVSYMETLYLENDLAFDQNGQQRTFFHSGLFAGVTTSSVAQRSESLERYLQLMQEYAKRALTYASDTYDTFAGIMARYFPTQDSTRVIKFWGVPCDINCNSCEMLAKSLL